MQLHSSFEALKPSKRGLARVLNREDPSDGAYARVIPLSEATVLKATSCSATNLLFETLLGLKKRRKHVPPALPAVLKDHGVCVKDADGIHYRVWEVERLFTEDQVQERTLARVSSRQLFAALKPDYENRTVLEGQALLGTLKNALRQEQSMLKGDLAWQSCASLAAAMAVRTDGHIREAFVFLHEFVLKHQVELDMLTQGNLLLDMFGQPVLSDPVNPADSDNEHRGPTDQVCLVVETPVAILPGFKVKVENRSTFGMSESDAERLGHQLSEHQVPWTMVSWSSPEHSALQRAPAKTVSLWSIPQAAKRLESDFYQRLLLNLD